MASKFYALMALLGTALAADPFGFNHRGKFFYSQVFYDPKDTVHYHIEVGLGCDNFKQNWTITALEESVGYVTSICDKDTRRCDVPNKFPWGADQANPSDACITNFTSEIISETARLNDGIDNAFVDPIPNYVLQGYSAGNLIRFTNPAFGRQKDVQMKSFAIMQSNGQTFTSPHYSGYLGFGPYSSDTEIRDENIIYHLKHSGIIDHAIISLYLQPKANGQSSIKFGGYDKAALHDPDDFDIFRTISKNSWTIKASDPFVNGQNFQTDSVKEIEFQVEPQLAMIYMPSDDYENFKNHVKDIFTDQVNCDLADKPCVFQTTCDKIPENDIPFHMTIKDDNTNRNITISRENLLMDGGVTGLEDTCFVGVYKLPTASTVSNIYYFGSPFFHEYYVSFSLESWENGYGDYLQVGIGPICKTAYLGDIVYNQQYDNFNPAMATNDTSESNGAQVTFQENLVNTCLPVPPDPEDTQLLGSQSNNTMLVVALSVGGAALLLTIIIISVYCCRKAAQKSKSFASIADGQTLLGYQGKSDIQADDSSISKKSGNPDSSMET